MSPKIGKRKHLQKLFLQRYFATFGQIISFMQLGLIDTNTIEGRLLMAAIGIITSTPPYTNKTPDETLIWLDGRQANIYKDAPPLPVIGPAPDFRESLRLAINRNNKEAGSDTPDIILTEYLMKCLEAFDEATRARDKYYLPS